jgi:hypothetical protein
MNRIYIDPEAIQNEQDGETNEDDNESSDNEFKDMQVSLNPLTPHDETTQAYRHGCCSLCDKPVTTVNLNPTVELTCVECEQMKEEGSDQRDQYVDPEAQEYQQQVLINNITMILKDMG